MILPLVPVLYQTALTLCVAAHYRSSGAPASALHDLLTAAAVPRRAVLIQCSCADGYHNAGGRLAECGSVRCACPMHPSLATLHPRTTPNRLPAAITARTNWELMELFMWPALPATANTQPREEKSGAPVPPFEPRTKPQEEKPGAAGWSVRNLSTRYCAGDSGGVTYIHHSSATQTTAAHT